MDKEDARYQKLEQLHERRKQVVWLHRKGYGVMAIVELKGLSYPTARRAIDLYEAGGAAALKPAARSGLLPGPHRARCGLKTYSCRINRRALFSRAGHRAAGQWSGLVHRAAPGAHVWDGRRGRAQHRTRRAAGHADRARGACRPRGDAMNA
ncbi:MAG: helix-turn-helix domain-containing protein [Tibeticola sp.]|nr:helix-turn-helix domain-containing protein [Tibeticola sp.]